MRDFSTTRKAKEYLIRQIANEAERASVALSEMERKMLYFSESGWTLPGILKVNEEFERDYDSNEYEQKIAGLIRGITSRKDRTQDEIDAWDNAVLKLSNEDHYLLVLIDLAGGGANTQVPSSQWLPAPYRPGSKRPEGDFSRLLVAAIVLSSVLLAFALLLAKLNP